jgi:hypothetical protein
MNELVNDRQATAIHEAAHAVISYMLSRRIMYAILFTDRDGEVVPMCSACNACLAYYGKNNPANDAHSKLIQDDLRCDMAIAVAGRLGQHAICGNQSMVEGDFDKDRARAKELASAIHFWKDHACWVCKYSAWEICSQYDKSITEAVSKILKLEAVENSIRALAVLFEQSKNCSRIQGDAIENCLKKQSLPKGEKSAPFQRHRPR